MLLLLACLGGCALLRRTEPAPEPRLREQVTLLPGKGPARPLLRTTLFLPDTPGPWPVALINHGKELGDAAVQARYRPLSPVRFFRDRGYAVVVPMRSGFAGSEGRFDGEGCAYLDLGLAQAAELSAVLDDLARDARFDLQRVVVVGQSFGGFATLALGSVRPAGVRGLINFAGGFYKQSCGDWDLALAKAVEQYARTTEVPSLWFYGDNDSYFDPPTWKEMLRRYQAAGGRAQLVAVGKFENDSHRLFGASAGRKIWQEPVERFLAALGLPAQRVTSGPGGR